MTILLFAIYLSSAAIALNLFARMRFINFARISLIPIVSGVMALNSVNIHEVINSTNSIAVFLLVVATITPLVLSVFTSITVARAFYRENDRLDILKLIAFNKPYPSAKLV